MELQFVDFLKVSRRRLRARHVVVAGRTVHPALMPLVLQAAESVQWEKHRGPVKVPRWPACLRRAHLRDLTRRARPDAVVLWNRARDGLRYLTALDTLPVVYWERGAAWFAGLEAQKRTFFRAVPWALCNSQAARRMLELRWDYRGEIHVCRNALRPGMMPLNVPPRELPCARAPVIGVAARLTPVKGTAVVLHALALLHKQGLKARLEVAGQGPEGSRLTDLARRLGIADAVCFHGLVEDMPAFYRAIDCLAHPALREPFGQVCVEAAAYGCPVIASGVDGLPEVVRDGHTGVIVKPTLPLADYAVLGGGRDALPPYVYDPVADVLTAPRIVDPAQFAGALMHLFTDAPRYAALSRAGVLDVPVRFDFNAHVTCAVGVLRRVADSSGQQ